MTIVVCCKCSKRRTIAPYKNSAEVKGLCDEHLVEARNEFFAKRVPITPPQQTVEPVKMGSKLFSFKRKQSA